MALVADRFGRNPKLQSKKSASKIGLEDDLGCLLAHPVTHGGDTQRPLAAVRFGDLHPTHRRRAVDACPEIRGQLIEHPSHAVVLHRRQGHLVDPGRATILTDPAPRLPQDVTPVDAVIQSVEPPTQRLLGRSP
jgi:hypothetical protein